MLMKLTSFSRYLSCVRRLTWRGCCRRTVRINQVCGERPTTCSWSAVNSFADRTDNEFSLLVSCSVSSVRSGSSLLSPLSSAISRSADGRWAILDEAKAGEINQLFLISAAICDLRES